MIWNCRGWEYRHICTVSYTMIAYMPYACTQKEGREGGKGRKGGSKQGRKKKKEKKRRKMARKEGGVKGLVL